MRTLAVVFASLLIAGCSSQPSGPTYAEAVATYQAEVALLDSLQAKLDRIQSEYNAKHEELKEKYDKMIDNDRAFDMKIYHGFNDPAKAAEHLEYSQKHIESLKEIRDKDYALARRAFDQESEPIKAEIMEQTRKTELAKSIRDSIGQ